MTLSHRISRSGLALIKSFEGFRERATRLPDGRWVIGHGHVKSAREGVRVSPEDAEALLLYDLKQIEDAMETSIFTPLNQNQHDALVSFVFNISIGLFRDSIVLKRLNSGDHLSAANAMEVWRKARINGEVSIVDALVRRRAIEKALFLEHPAGRVAAATPFVVPRIDEELFAENLFQTGSESTEKSDISDMRSAIEALASSGNSAPDLDDGATDIDDILNAGKSDNEEAEPTVTNTDAFDPTELSEKEVVYIGESDEDVFNAIGVEVDEALQDNFVTEKPLKISALASQNVDRLVANDVEEIIPPFETIDDDFSTEEEPDTEDVSEVINEEEKTLETPEEVISSLLAETSLQEARSELESGSVSKTPEAAAAAVAERLDRLFEPELLTLSDEVNDKVLDMKGEGRENAWDLSKDLRNEQLSYLSNKEAAKKPVVSDVEDVQVREDKRGSGYGYAEKAIQKDKFIDDLEVVDVPRIDVEIDRSNGHSPLSARLWLGALIGSIALIIFGVVDFYKKAQPGQIVNQSDIAYGPLMIAVGGLVFLMAAYFLVSRRGSK